MLESSLLLVNTLKNVSHWLDIEVYNINHNITIRHCSFEYALHIHDLIYEGAL